MRELHVAGYNADENSIILRDPTTEEEFSVIADEQLRAAARGDVPGLRQVRIEKSNTMRPSEIQELIRAGASTDELADRAGMQRSRLDNLARPILMERANMVRRAQESHPLLADGPSDITLAMAAHTGLSTRGIDYHDGSWDSWKTADGHWIIELRWEEGHADNTAHWRFQQDRSYAITSPIDETASELTDPSFVPSRPTSVTSISNLGAARLRNSRTSQETRHQLAVAAQRDAAGLPDGSRPGSVRRRTPGYVKSVTVSMDDLTNPTTPGPVRSLESVEASPPATAASPAPAETTRSTAKSRASKSTKNTTSTPPTEQLSLDNIRQFAAYKSGTAADIPDSSADKSTPSASSQPEEDEGTTPPIAKFIPPVKPLSASPSAHSADDDHSRRAARKKQKHPTMPSWEDVLLGVRGQQND
ncbi:hypothetical protein AL705_02375 [Lawsonella clevelandensis]|uniref:DUF3071 domain-containing protein n=1 Tax=Lawsonella clevelandensis TaxID=1528099 RepID=A0A0M3TBJ0_9ACTN|nr:septation protein SepH [Lawsonella clevelandensis]ALE18714.1 hypothetical protein AL705_02375 [Lawsonella clevelandensis]